MKRRTNSAANSRPRVPLPRSDRRDIEGFFKLYQGQQMARQCMPPPLAAIADECLQDYLTERGLEFRATPEKFEGFEVWELVRAGERLATFSVEKAA